MAKFIGESSQTRLCEEIEKIVFINGKSKVSDICKMISIDRAAWYRWKRHQQRLTLKRARQLCSAAGLNPSIFLDGVDVDEQSITRPHQKFDYILPLYRKYRVANKKASVNALLVEAACNIQEILAESDILLELSTQLHRETPSVTLQSSDPWLRVVLQHGESPIVNVMSSPTTTEATFILGREALPELIKFMVRIDNQHKSVHKRESNVLENMASRLISRL